MKGKGHNRSLRKLNTNRINELAKPRVFKEPKQEDTMKLLEEAELHMGISKEVKNLKENADSLSKIKYKHQFLEALRDYNTSSVNPSSPIKSK